MDKELLEQLKELVTSDPEAAKKLQQMLNPEPTGIADKLKDLVKSSGYRIKDLQEPMQVNSPAAVNKKLVEGRFPFQDIIRIVAMLGGSLTVRVGDRIVEFTEEDL